MTLLSIREQEAVQETVVMRDMERWDSAIVNRAELDAYTQRVILATRDAIARQVREENARLESGATLKGSVAFHAWKNAATFVEGISL